MSVRYAGKAPRDAVLHTFLHSRATMSCGLILWITLHGNWPGFFCAHPVETVFPDEIGDGGQKTMAVHSGFPRPRTRYATGLAQVIHRLMLAACAARRQNVRALGYDGVLARGHPVPSGGGGVW